MKSEKIKVTIWNEYRHEREEEEVAAIYPDGIHNFIANFLSDCSDMQVRTAYLDEKDNGIPDEVLDDTDVLIWWGHCYHELVETSRVDYIKDRVYNKGMGFIALHSSHYSLPFKSLVGATGSLSWGRNQHEIVWNMKPSHPIAAGIPDHFDLDIEELYAEPFYIPNPDDIVFASWFEDGYIFRSGCTFTRGVGKIFYFQPGHETARSFYNPYVQQIIKNAVRWAKPSDIGYEIPEGSPYVKKAIKE